MAGVPAGLPAGVRVSDPISLGVIARAFPLERVRRVLAETGKASERERDLPAQVMVHYAVAMAPYMGSSTREVLRCLLEGLRWLWGAQLGRHADGETTLAHGVAPALRPGMLGLADRQLFGHALWQAGAATGADLLWRVKSNPRLPRAAALADGS